MKLIDQYLLRTFLAPWLYSLGAFIMVFIVWDLFGHLDNFIEAGTPLLSVMKFYVFLMPSVMILILPITLLLGVLYGLYQLTRHNEIIAMRAGGISLYRVVLPILCFGLLSSVVVWVINESLAPKSAYWTEKFLEAQKLSESKLSVYTYTNVPYRNEEAKRTWIIREFDTHKMELRGVNVSQIREDGTIDQSIQAETAHWLDGHWWFEQLTLQKYLPDGRKDPKGLEEEGARMMNRLTESPEDILRTLKNPEYMSTAELREFLASHPQASSKKVAEVKTKIYSRLAMPWMCVIVVMLGVPFGAQTARKGALRGVLLCFGMVLTYQVLSQVFQALGFAQTLPPWAAGWLPNILFFALGAVLINRMR